MRAATLLLALALAFLARRCSPAPPQPSAAALFVLGDSTVNCGDNNVFLSLLPSSHPSSAFCLPAALPLLPDLIAGKMGLGRLPPFYGANGTAEAMAVGVNFGSTPAMIVSGSISPDAVGWGLAGLFVFQTLSQQVRQAYEALQLLRLQLGPEAEEGGDFAGRSLFLLSFGKDDLVGLLERGGVSAKYGRRRIARFLASEMVRAVQDLYNAGVRRMAVMGVGPLGCAPRVLWERSRGGEGTEGCVDEANEVVARYNALLADGLREAGERLPGALFVFCDVYRAVMEIISNPLLYGFENVRDACCGEGGHGGMIGCLVKEMACSNPSSYVWWDLYRNTKAVNTLLADWVWSSNARLNICEPVALQQLVYSSA